MAMVGEGETPEQAYNRGVLEGMHKVSLPRIGRDKTTTHLNHGEVAKLTSKYYFAAKEAKEIQMKRNYYPEDALILGLCLHDMAEAYTTLHKHYSECRHRLWEFDPYDPLFNAGPRPQKSFNALWDALGGIEENVG